MLVWEKNSFTTYFIINLLGQQKSLSRVRLFVTPQTVYSSWNFPGQNMGVDSHSLLRGSSKPRDWTQVSHTEGGFFTSWVTREAQEYWSG